MSAGVKQNELDWLKRVAGVDDAYLARWPRVAWDEWARAMRAGREDPCPSVPEWMRPLMPDWHRDFSLAFPCVAQLWPTSHEWFTEAENHSDLVLVVEAPEEGWWPQLNQVHQAWRLSAEHDLHPRMMVSVVPVISALGELDGVAAEIEAFYVDALPETASVIAQLEEILGAAPGPSVGPLRGESVLAWEWMYG